MLPAASSAALLQLPEDAVASLLKTWGEATSQVKAPERDVKRHTLISRKHAAFSADTEQRRWDGDHGEDFRPHRASTDAENPSRH